MAIDLHIDVCNCNLISEEDFADLYDHIQSIVTFPKLSGWTIDEIDIIHRLHLDSRSTHGVFHRVLHIFKNLLLTNSFGNFALSLSKPNETTS